MTVRFGLLGCGVIGGVHTGLIARLGDEGRLVAVADRDETRAKEFADQHRVQAFADLDQLVQASDVDAVSICLPSGLHADAAVRCLDAGKDVIVEKPIDITLEAADRIIDAERRSGRTVTVISQRRFQPAARRIHDAVAAGDLGRITSGVVESTFWRSQAYYDSGGWRGTWEHDGGGALMNQGVHAVDLLVWMLGEPVEVSAYAATLAHERIDVEDTISATVRFAGGALGTITATTAGYPGRTVRLLVNGDRGQAVFEDERLQSMHTIAHGDADTADTELDIDDAHLAQYRDFVAAVRDGRAPEVTTADGRRALALVLAIYRSAREGGTPIQL